MSRIHILIHASGSANDAHLQEAIPRAVKLARDRGLTVEPVERLAEIKDRLLLPAQDPQAADAALSADSTHKILGGIVRHLNPVSIRNETGEAVLIRSPLAAVLPTADSRYQFVLSDAGAYAENDPLQIAAGALLCGSFWRVAYTRQHARYGILGIGEEASKLPAVAREVYDLLKTGSNRVVKIVEPKDILGGDSAEVLVVRNGEIGNIFLKTAEAALAALGSVIRKEIRAEFLTTVGGALAKPALDRAKAHFYNREVHGAFFLGIEKPVMKHHGRMGAEDLFAAIERLALYTEKGIIPRTRADFQAQLEASPLARLP